MNRIELKAAISLAFVYVLRMLGLFMVMPVLALLATDFPDYAPWLVGLAIGGYGLTQAVLQIPMGVLSDKIGRKPVILGGLVMFALGSAIAAMADSMIWLIVGRFLQGAGAIAGAIMALAGDVSRESQRSKVMAVIGIAIGFSFYLSLLLGPLIAKSYGLQGIFAVTAVLALFCLPLVKWIVPDATNVAPSGDTLPVLDDLKGLAGNPQLLRLNVSVALLHMTITVLFMQFPPLLSAVGYGLDEHWQIYLPILVSSILGMAILMTMSRKHGQVGVIKLAVALLGASTLGFAFSGGEFWMLMAFCWLFFTAFNFLEANFPALVSSIAPAGKKGSAMGIFASCQFFGAFLGGVISGLLNQYFVPELVFVVTSIICLFWLVWLKGLHSTELLKRYTLPLNTSEHSAEHLGRQLADLAGVQDITLVPEQQIAYLKVDASQFDLRKARKVANVE